MADQKTAMEWGVTAAAKREEAAIATQKEREIQSQITPIASELKQVSQQNARDNQTINGPLGKYIDQRGGVNGIQSTNPNGDNYVDPTALEKYNTAKSRIDANTAKEQELNQQLAPLTAARGDAASMRVAAETEAKNADNQQAEAEKGPADTKTNTPPVVDPSTEQKAAADAKATSEADANTKSAAGTTPVAPSSDPAAARAQLAAEERAAGITGTDAGASPGLQNNPAAVAAKTSTVTTGTQAAQNSATVGKYIQSKDWRVKIQLAPAADYLYKSKTPGILQPIKDSDGVIFPYTPTIQLGYTATYDSYDLTHSNYKSYTYKGSAVEQISITADFTAQDTTEANYVLAVMHFFRSVTKMFYGKDNSPQRGTPPPLVYLSGYGAYNFDNHPMVVTSFGYSLPPDIDYISASITTDKVGASVSASLTPQQVSTQKKTENPFTLFKEKAQRLLGSGLNPGAAPPTPVFLNSTNIADATRVPTKIQFNINCLPIITRYNMSNNFSLKEYATGALLRGSKNPNNGGGVW